MARFWSLSSISTTVESKSSMNDSQSTGTTTREAAATTNTQKLKSADVTNNNNHGYSTMKQTSAIHSPLRIRPASYRDSSCLTSGADSSGTSKAVPITTSHRDAPASSSSSSALPLPPPSSPRRRFNSRDIPRTYSGLYGNTDDLLPFELHRHRMTSQSIWFLLATYLILIAIVQIFYSYVTMVVAEYVLYYSTTAAEASGDASSEVSPAVSSSITSFSWTLTNLTHLALTLVYVHWLKGSLGDEQGEMNGLTVWEQLEATADTLNIRRALLIVPTLLTYAACHFSNYQHMPHCVLNLLAWLIAMLAKLPCMNGVRIFGINRTAGIDDDQIVLGRKGPNAKKKRNRPERYSR